MWCHMIPLCHTHLLIPIYHVYLVQCATHTLHHRNCSPTGTSCDITWSHVPHPPHPYVARPPQIRPIHCVILCKTKFTCMLVLQLNEHSISFICVQWNPALQTPLNSGHPRYNRQFWKSRLAFHWLNSRHLATPCNGQFSRPQSYASNSSTFSAKLSTIAAVVNSLTLD